MSEQSNHLEDYVLSTREGIDIKNMTLLSVEDHTDISHIKPFNASKLSSSYDKHSASSVGSTKTIDSIKRPSENFLGNFFNNSTQLMNKSPPRPLSSTGNIDFINMTSINLQRHNNLTNSTFDIFNRGNQSEEDVPSFFSDNNTPVLIPDSCNTDIMQSNKDTRTLSNQMFKKEISNSINDLNFAQPPTRASTSTTTTTNPSDVVMSHQSQPSTGTAGTKEEGKIHVDVIYSPIGDSLDVSSSPQDLNGKLSDTEIQEDQDTTLKSIEPEKMTNKDKHKRREIAIELAQSAINSNIKKIEDADYGFSEYNEPVKNDIRTIQNQRYMFQSNIPDISRDNIHDPHLSSRSPSPKTSNTFSQSSKLQYYQMTPSQRLRYRREQGKNKVKNSAHFKEYVYDKLESTEKLHYQHGNIYSQPPPQIGSGKKSANGVSSKKGSFLESPIIWNVPMSSNESAMIGFNNPAFSQKHPSSGKSSSKNSISMPITPVFGVSDRKDLIDGFNQTTISLSELYLEEQLRQRQEKLDKRRQDTEFLSETLKEATREGLEDAQFISREKLNHISSSRPSWLPVKDVKENQRHEKDIYRTVSNASIDKLQFNKKFENLPDVVLEMKVKFDKLFNVDLDENEIINSTSVFTGLCKIMWEYPVITNIENRYNTYSKLLLADIYKENKFSDKEEIENFLGIDYCLTQKTVITNLIKAVLSQYDDNISADSSIHAFRQIPDVLYQLVSLRYSSTNEADMQKSIVVYDVLLRAYGVLDIKLIELQNYENRADIEYLIRKIWDIEQLISKICFNKVVEAKYNDRIVNKKGLIAQNMKMEYGFDLEFTAENLNFKNFLQILNKLPNKLGLWVLDEIMINNTVLMNKNSFEYYLNKVNVKYENSYDKNKDETYNYWLNKYSTNNYKILVSLTLSVLLNYHFGYSDFKELSSLSLLNYNLLGFSNKSILEILTTIHPPNMRRQSKIARNGTSLSISRSSSGVFFEPRHSSLASVSIKSSYFSSTTSDLDDGSEVGDMGANVNNQQTVLVESLDFMNLTSLDLMGVRNYSFQEEDEDEYMSMEGFIKKWQSYYKKL